MKTIAIGADDAAYAFRDSIVAYLNGLGINVADYSSDKRQGSTVYPDVAHAVAMSIKQGEHERGILICGTGIGMSIVANKVPGVRAAQCHDTFSAERARKSNNAQIITLGARVIGAELGKKLFRRGLSPNMKAADPRPKWNVLIITNTSMPEINLRSRKIRNQMMSQLDELKKYTTVVADTGDIESIKKFAPQDATTNPSLVLKAAQLPQYQPLIADAIGKARRQGGSAETQLINACDQVAVDIGSEALRHVPGRISTEVDARFAWDRGMCVAKARKLIQLYEKMALVPSGF